MISDISIRIGRVDDSATIVRMLLELAKTLGEEDRIMSLGDSGFQSLATNPGVGE